LTEKTNDYWSWVCLGLFAAILIPVVALHKADSCIRRNLIKGLAIVLRLPAYPFYRLGILLDTSERLQDWINKD